MAAQSVAEGRLPNGALARVLMGDQVSSDQRDQMLGVLQAAFSGRWPAFELPVSPREHLDWKLEGPEPSLSPYVTLLETDDRIVSLTITLRERTLASGREFELEGGVDACTHPDYERRGMFSQRREFEKGNIEQWLAGILSFSLNPTVMRWGRRQRRPEQLANVPKVLLRVFDAGRLARDRHEAGMRLPVPVLASGLFALQGAGALLARRRAPRPSWTLEEVGRFDERFDELFASAASDFRFIKVRSAAYLNWRYADPRAGLFTTIAASEGDRLLGYVTFKVQKGRGYVLDLLVRRGRLDVARSLVGRAVEAFTSAGTSAAVCWLPGRHPYRGVFRQHGFIDVHQSTGASLGRYPNADPAAFAFIPDPRAPIHVMLGDSDWA